MMPHRSGFLRTVCLAATLVSTAALADQPVATAPIPPPLPTPPSVSPNAAPASGLPHIPVTPVPKPHEPKHAGPPAEAKPHAVARPNAEPRTTHAHRDNKRHLAMRSLPKTGAARRHVVRRYYAGDLGPRYTPEAPLPPPWYGYYPRPWRYW